MSPEPSIREFDVDVPYAAPEHAITVPQADSDPIVHSNLTVMRDE